MGEAAGTTTEVALYAHPAVRAWRRLRPALGSPRGVETLKETAERSVYRLIGVEALGGDAIAKRSPSGTLEVEQLIYEEVLPGLGSPALRCHGLVADPDRPDDWLFLQASGGEAYSPLREEHRALAGRWLGRLHTYVPAAAVATHLPERGPFPYLAYLRAGRDLLLRHLASPSLQPGDAPVLEAIVDDYARVEQHQPWIDGVLAGLPRALVHGDFVARNLHVRVDRHGLVLLPFDWQDAGWGTPVLDLAQAPLPSTGFAGNPAIPSYWWAVRDHWPWFDLPTLQELANLATLFRCLAAISWDAPGLGRWGPKVGERMGYYQAALAHVLQRAGWEA